VLVEVDAISSFDPIPYFPVPIFRDDLVITPAGMVFILSGLG
jgi:hypothetical protein